MDPDETAQWAVSSGSTLFDIQSFTFTYKRLFMWWFIKIKNADDKCRLKFGTESVSCISAESWFSLTNNRAYDKTYYKTCVTIKDSEQRVHPLSTTTVLVYLSLDSPKAVGGIAISEDSKDCVDAKTDLSLRW